MTTEQSAYAPGDPVEKYGGDYSFAGEVRAVVVKRGGAVRYVVEDDRGLLLILSAKQLRPQPPQTGDV